VTTPDDHVEREVKLDADLDFVLPALDGVDGTVRHLSDQQLRTAYFDTVGLSLWSRGVTLRHRYGGDGVEGGPGTWTVKLPEDATGPTVDRTERTWAGPRDEVPAGARTILAGMVRGRALVLLVELVSTRRRLVVEGPDGTPAAEIDDDTVTVVGGSHDGCRFRQIEVELGPGGDALVGPLVGSLRAAGARPGGGAKVAEALDPAPGRPPAPDRRSTMTDVVRAAVTAGLDQLLVHDAHLRSAPDDPPVHDVHQARVATRRLRSDLGLCGPVLDPAWLAATRDDLRWLGQVLGRVRDADVLAGSLHPGPDVPAEVREGCDRLQGALLAERRADCRDLARVLADDRYLALVGRLEEAAVAPPVVPEADERASWALPRLVGGRWRALRRRVRRAGRRPDDRALHRLRILAKQLRYASETAVPVIGRRARRTASAAEGLQSVLGEFHDTVTAEAWLRLQARHDPDGVGPAVAWLVERQRRARRRLRRRWRPAWERLDDPKRRRWL